MEDNRASTTALMAAWVRAFHYAHDTPKIFADPLAHTLLSEADRDLCENRALAALAQVNPSGAPAGSDPSARQAALARFMRVTAGPPAVLSRARFAEDKLVDAVARGADQYVLVGAGLETFAWRRSPIHAELRVFEVDHPATQALKRERLETARITTPAHTYFVAADLERERLDAALKTVPSYDLRVPTFFSWLGVTAFLSRAAVFGTLRAIRAVAAPGSSVAFDYVDSDAFDPRRSAPKMQALIGRFRGSGEPFASGLETATLEADLADVGFRLQERLPPDEIEARYFRRRSDGFQATEHVHFVVAVVE
jgi:methyltransferase (TIGR00027 family)